MTTPHDGPGPSIFLMHGLRVACAADLYHPTADESASPDITLLEQDPFAVPSEDPPGLLLARLDDHDGRRLYAFTETDEGYCLRFFDAGEALVSRSLQHVTWRSDHASPEDLMPLLFNGAIVSFLLMMRGHGLMHASAVEVDGRAMAYVGRSGLGKSTMAALSCAAGAALLTDDVLRVDTADGAAVCYRGTPENRLRRSIEDVLGDDIEVSRHRATVDGRTAVRLKPSELSRAPLTAVVVPLPSPDRTTPRLRRVDGVDAVALLAGFPRLLGWQHQATAARQFEFLADLVALVPVYTAELPWGPPFSTDMAPAVLAHVGLTGRPISGQR